MNSDDEDVFRSGIGGDYTPTTWEGHVTKEFNENFMSSPSTAPGPAGGPSSIIYRQPKTAEQKERSFKWAMAWGTMIIGLVFLHGQDVFPPQAAEGNAYMISVGITALVILLTVRFVPYVAKLIALAFAGGIAYFIYRIVIAW